MSFQSTYRRSYRLIFIDINVALRLPSSLKFLRALIVHRFRFLLSLSVVSASSLILLFSSVLFSFSLPMVSLHSSGHDGVIGVARYSNRQPDRCDPPPYQVVQYIERHRIVLTVVALPLCVLQVISGGSTAFIRESCTACGWCLDLAVVARGGCGVIDSLCLF